jgi:membrane-bound lytic murein transglycosylase A
MSRKQCPVCPEISELKQKQVEVGQLPGLRFVPENEIPYFEDKLKKEDFYRAGEKSIEYLKSISEKKRFYAFADRKVTPELLAKSIKEFFKMMEESRDTEELNRKIREKFDVYQMLGKTGIGDVVFSSYYEPVIPASPLKTTEYKYPIYAKPDSLILAELEDFNPKFKGERITGRIQDGKLVPYLTREEIDFKKVLEGKNLELAWFKDRVDIMDLHIQGSGRLQFPGGKQVRAKFAATNSLPFRGWMTTMVNAGMIPKEDLTYEKAKKYVLEHPKLEEWILSSNKRYTFFEIEEIKDPSQGPEGTYAGPLFAGRSIAVDNALIPLGALTYISVNLPEVDSKGKLMGIALDSRFVFCQDTGGAIKGPGRIDFFAGHGPKAKTFARSVWETGKVYILILKPDENEKI